jgi:hypothetical protein
MKTAKALVQEGYSRSEVVHLLSHQRLAFSRSPITIPTFYRWLNTLGITPKLRYAEIDLQRLTRLSYHFMSGGTENNIPNDLLGGSKHEKTTD